MSGPTAIIVGAGVAGLSAAWWLDRIGWRSVIIERAADLRWGGYMMSLSGPGYEVARRMDLIGRLEQVGHPGSESIYLDRHGRELLRLRHRELLKEFPYLVLRRSDLVRALAEMTKAHTEVRLATEVTDIANRPDGVTAMLSDGSSLVGDLLIGADGIRSSIRARVLAADTEVLRPLGYRFAAYDVPDTLSPGADFLSYAGPGRISEFYRLSDSRLAALHVWSRPTARGMRNATGAGPAGDDPPPDLRDLAERFADDHPNVMRIIAAGAQGERPPLVDDMLLVEAPSWSRNRVVLLGDAAHCITLISGQGAGMAMTGAAVLAEELGRGAGIAAGLAAYERRMRVPVERLQMRSRNIARWFVPHSAAAFHLRNLILRSMPSRMLAGYFRRSLQSEILASSLADPPLAPGDRPSSAG